MFCNALDARSVKISKAGKVGPDFVVQIPSLADHTHQVQVISTLTPPNWTGLGASRPGTGGILAFTDPGVTTNSPARFYRVDVTAP